MKFPITFYIRHFFFSNLRLKRKNQKYWRFSWNTNKSELMSNVHIHLFKCRFKCSTIVEIARLVESFSSRLNERRTEKQLNSLSANENRCGFANYVSRTSMSYYCHPHLTSSFLSFPHRPLSLSIPFHRRRRLSSSPSSPSSSSSVKVSWRVLLPEHALFRQTFRAEARNFSFPPIPSRYSLLFRRVCILSVTVTIAVSPQAAGQNSIQIHSVKLKLYRSRSSEAKSFNREIKNGLSSAIFEFP